MPWRVKDIGPGPDLDHLLTGATAKFTRANLHAYTLCKQAPKQPEGIDTLDQLDPNATEHVLTLIWEIRYPWFPTIFGDAVHNFRTCLDHLLCGLILMTGRRLKGREQFPIMLFDPAHPRTDKERAVAKAYGWLLGRIAEPQRAILDGVQPYKGSDPGAHTLAVLNRLDNDDKHVQLTPHLVVPTDFRLDVTAVADCSISKVEKTVGAELNVGAEIGRVFYTATGAEPQISVKTRMTPEIRLEKGGREVFSWILEVQEFLLHELLEPLVPNFVRRGGDAFVAMTPPAQAGPSPSKG
jgi:hypothetical protein